MVYLVKIVMFMHHSGNKLELLTYRVCDGVYTFFFFLQLFSTTLKKNWQMLKTMLKKIWIFSDI